MAENITTTDTLPEDEKLDKFKLDIINDADIVEDQRDKANEDMRFVNVDGGQWEGFFDDSSQPDRVKLELDMVSNYLQSFIGEWTQNRVNVEFKPDDSKTSDDDSELLNGIYRADFRSFSGTIATDNAVLECATCGYGAIKLATIFEDDEDELNDLMRIEFRPIYNAYNTVFWDQAAQRIDKKDARWVTTLKEFTVSSYEDAYPGKDPVSAYVPNSLAFENVHTSTPTIIYVATRYEVIKKKESIFIYNNLATGDVETYSAEDHKLIKNELKADELRKFVRERKIIRRRVEKTVFSGEEILEKTRRIVGKWLPIVPFYGYRSYVDGVEWYRGLIRKLKDAQRLLNMQMSQLAENSASAGQEVPIFATDQMQNPDIQAAWADKNNKPYLLVDPLLDGNGNVIASGPIGYSKPAMLDQSTATLLNVVPQYMQGVTGAALQESIDPDASGKAIKEIRKLKNMNTQVVTDNIASAFQWIGVVYESKAQETYTTQRIIRTVGKDGAEGEKQLLKTVLDKETGRLIESNNLLGKKFRAYSDVGPQYDTLREQTVEDLKGILELFVSSGVGAEYTDAMLAVLLNNITGVGLEPIKELNRRIMLAKGLTKPETDEEKAMVDQLQEQAQQPDGQQELIKAAANQQNSEARNLDSKSLSNVADAEKKQAETAEILEGIDMDKFKLFLERQDLQLERTIKTVENLPIR